MKYRKDIDGLRAVAVLAVVLFHAKIAGFSGGFVGVDVFFVISGFLITGMIVDDLEHGRFSFIVFYGRRIRRIIPALLTIYLACMAAAALLMLPSDAAELGRSVMASASFVSNIFFYNRAGYFGGQSDLKPLLHTWSLSIEEQFYLVWPVLLFAVSRWRYRAIAASVWVLGAITFAASVAVVAYNKEAAFFLAPFRACELMLGAALALLAGRSSIDAVKAEICAAAGLILILGSVLALDEADPFPGLLAVPPCLGTALLIYAGMNGQPSVTRMLSARPLVAIGLVSYSLYLWHWPILSFARYYFDRALRWEELAGLLALSAVAAFLTYRYVEQPARRISVRHARHIFGAGVISLAVFALAGRQMERSGGWTFNLDPEIRRLDTAARSENIYRRKCNGAEKALRDDDMCTFGRRRVAGSYDMAIFGDSHADAFTPAMSVLAQEAGLSGRQVTVGGCLALFGYYEIVSPFATEARCRALRDAMVQFVDQNPRLQFVAIAHRWSIYTGAPTYHDEGRFPIYVLGGKGDVRSEQRSRQVLHESLQQTVAFFEQRGIRVLLLGEPPPLGRDPTKCIAKAIKRGRNSDSCGRSIEEVRRRLHEMNMLLSEVANERRLVAFFSPLETMCTKTWCSPFLNGVYAYRDGDHLNRLGAESLAAAIRLPALAPRP
jgi:peptidoglycan/LPS O-acetylase OafA/YrhL